MPPIIPSLRATIRRRVGVGVLWMKYSLISRIGRRRSADLYRATIKRVVFTNPGVRHANTVQARSKRATVSTCAVNGKRLKAVSAPSRSFPREVSCAVSLRNDSTPQLT
jgi:hypothetical protein